MQKTTIVVLANSIKNNERCLAGKEIARTGEHWRIGGWIRPVGTAAGAEVPVALMRRCLGREPRLLEIIEVPFEKAVPLPDQPENWLLDNNERWNSVGDFPRTQIESLIDSPQLLWNDSGSRRVAKGFPQRMQQPASLYLIKPDEFVSIEVWAEPNPFEPPPAVKRHRQVRLRYGGVIHTLDITDLEFANKYYPNFPAPGAPRTKINLPHPNETLLCTSLTPEFRGHHYKLVAAFISPP
jgi:hypothetical protein